MILLIILLVIALVVIIQLYLDNKKLSKSNKNASKVIQFLESVNILILTTVRMTKEEADLISEELNKLAEKTNVENPFKIIKKESSEEDS